MIGSSEDADENEFSLSLSTVHGVKFNSTVMTGIGVGIDTYYHLKAFPVFLSLMLDPERKKQGMFFQLNGGYSFVRYISKDEDFEEIEVDEKGGLMLNPMVGFRMEVENMRIYVQAGYKYQAAELHYDYPDWWGSSQSSRHYELNRFVIQLGFGLQ